MQNSRNFISQVRNWIEIVTYQKQILLQERQRCIGSCLYLAHLWARKKLVYTNENVSTSSLHLCNVYTSESITHALLIIQNVLYLAMCLLSMTFL